MLCRLVLWLEAGFQMTPKNVSRDVVKVDHDEVESFSPLCLSGDVYRSLMNHELSYTVV